MDATLEPATALKIRDTRSPGGAGNQQHPARVKIEKVGKGFSIPQDRPDSRGAFLTRDCLWYNLLDGDTREQKR